MESGHSVGWDRPGEDYIVFCFLFFKIFLLILLYFFIVFLFSSPMQGMPG